MGVSKYIARGKTWWRVDEWLAQPDGTFVRYRKKRIPTKEQAVACATKVKAESFEGRFFDRVRTPTSTVADLWSAYQPIAKRDNDAWQTDLGRAKHLVRHLAMRRAFSLTLKDIDAYRTRRLSESTLRGTQPASATLDREVELLKRILNYAVACGTLPNNPVANAKLLRKPNVRRVVLDEAAFQRLLEASEESLKPILLVAFDTGMRQREILDLRWEQVDLRQGVVRLAPQDTKGEESRLVVLTKRVRTVLEELPRGLPSTPVFRNPRTGEAWQDIRKAFHRAGKAAGLDEVWFHDLRRSFVTRARRLGVPESVVMRMSGHRTRAVFDRYNIVSEDDLREAVSRIEAENFGHALDTLCEKAPKSEKRRELTARDASAF
jgi:integrase